MKQRQQTITQMDPFRPLFHPYLDDDDMKYEDPSPEPLENHSKRRKRRKIFKDEKCTPVTRVSTSVSTSVSTREAGPMTVQSPPSAKAVWLEDLPDTSNGIKDRNEEMGPSMLMPPPKTPKSSIKKEIPSSQSPIDTPSSLRSKSYLVKESRSPLTERSVNSSPSMSRTRSIRKWKITKEVADSMEYDEDEACSTPTRLFYTARGIRHQAASASSSGPSVRSPFRPKPLLKELRESNADDGRGLDRLEGDSNSADMTAPTHVRTVIYDSDDEDFDAREGCFDAGEETQAVFASTESSSDDTWDQAQPGVILESTVMTKGNSSQAASGIVGFSDTSISTHKGRGTSKSRFASSRPTNRVTRSDSELANAQLLEEMQRSTLPQGTLQAESQLGTDCNSSHTGDETNLLTGATPLGSSSTLSEFPPHFLTSPTQPRHFAQDPNFLPTKRLAYPKAPVTAHAKGSDPPIPPSQATTVDLTQQLARPDIIEVYSSQPMPSSPPLIPPDHSSPLREGQEQNDESQRGEKDFEWRASAPPLTESQLLPQSLMLESIMRPPAEWQLGDMGDEH